MNGFRVVKKYISEIEDNSIVEIVDRMYYMIDFRSDTQEGLFQSLDGSHRLVISNGPNKVDVLVPKIRGFELVSNEGIEKTQTSNKVNGAVIPCCGILPKRGSSESAGYDIISPVDFTVPAGGKVTIYSNVKAYMQSGEMLIALPKSSGGIKLDLMLANTVGLIDSDYYNNSSNEGNIAVCLRSLNDEDVTYKAGDGICQVIFMPFLVSDNCNTEDERIGGIGSTGGSNNG